MLLLGNLGQQLDIHDTQAALRNLDARLRASGRFDAETSQYLHDLHRDFHELRLHHAALVELLLKKNLVTREEIAELVDRIDRSDGRADGKTDGPLPR